MYQVFEYSATGGKHSVSKPYSTWLGAKRIRNSIHRDFPYYKHTVEEVEV